MKRLTLVLLLVVGGVLSLLAQRTVTGTVTSAQDEPLIGATILVKGTTTGTVTDIDGTFSLEVPEGSDVLIVSYTGYNSQEIEIGNQSQVSVVLEQGVSLDEIIVTGQGVGLERKRLTTTVDVISAEDIEAAPITQLDQVLQSRLPGTQIRLSSGQPGTASLIRNRGPISANAATTPVIIIDGVRVDNLNGAATLSVGTGGAQSSALADIPIESIERVEFIRGGAATTLYGADAANGVLQIFTKRGTSGAARVSLEAQVGAMRGEETFLNYDETADLYYETGLVQQYRLGVDGGNDRVTYNFSGSFYDDDGFNDINEQRRVSFRSGVSAQVAPSLEYSASAAFTSNYFTRDYNANTSFARYGNLETADFGVLPELSDRELNSIDSLLREQARFTDITEAVRRFQISNTFIYNPLENLSARFTFGLDSRRSRAQDRQTNSLLVSKGSVAPGTNNQGGTERATRDFITLTTDLSIQYRIDAGDFSFISTAGGQFFREQDEQYEYNASNLPDGTEDIDNAADVSIDEFSQTIAFGGFYFSENIGYKNKLFLDAAVRWDFNSAFGDNIGLQDIYRLGLTYSLTDEPFIQESSIANVLTRFSLRANYGQATNFPTPFLNEQTFAVNPYLGGLSVTFGNPGNANLGPERVDSYEAGVDMSFFDARFALSFTYYNATTQDAIFNIPSTPSSGLGNQETNVGEVENKGVEIQTTINIIQKRDFDLSFNGSVTTNTNTVVSSGGAAEFAIGGFTFLGSFVKEGQPLGYLRGDNPSFDAEGNLVDVEPNAVLGDPNPDAYGNAGLNFRWKRLSAFVSADYQFGAQGVNVDDVLRFFNGASVLVPENALGESFFDLAGVWVEDIDFIKVRNVGISYDIPVQNSPLSRLQVGINMRNPYVWGSSNFDPETTGAGISNGQGGLGVGGFGFGTESAPKQYTFTLRLGF